MSYIKQTMFEVSLAQALARPLHLPTAPQVSCVLKTDFCPWKVTKA